MTKAISVYLLEGVDLKAEGWVNVLVVSEAEAQIDDLMPYYQDLSTRRMCFLLQDETNSTWMAICSYGYQIPADGAEKITDVTGTIGIEDLQ